MCPYLGHVVGLQPHQTPEFASARRVYDARTHKVLLVGIDAGQEAPSEALERPPDEALADFLSGSLPGDARPKICCASRGAPPICFSPLEEVVGRQVGRIHELVDGDGQFQRDGLEGSGEVTYSNSRTLSKTLFASNMMTCCDCADRASVLSGRPLMSHVRLPFSLSSRSSVVVKELTRPASCS